MNNYKDIISENDRQFSKIKSSSLHSTPNASPSRADRMSIDSLVLMPPPQVKSVLRSKLNKNKWNSSDVIIPNTNDIQNEN
jgi:hypothetical protein